MSVWCSRSRLLCRRGLQSIRLDCFMSTFVPSPPSLNLVCVLTAVFVVRYCLFRTRRCRRFDVARLVFDSAYATIDDARLCRLALMSLEDCRCRRFRQPASVTLCVCFVSVHALLRRCLLSARRQAPIQCSSQSPHRV